MSRTAGMPAARLESAGFSLQSTGYSCMEIYAPSGKQVATLEWDKLTLRLEGHLATEIATLLIRYYSPSAIYRNK